MLGGIVNEETVNPWSSLPADQNVWTGMSKVLVPLGLLFNSNSEMKKNELPPTSPWRLRLGLSLCS
jgi:hypothetical protein